VGNGWVAYGAAWAIVIGALAQLALLKIMDPTPLFGRERMPVSELWMHMRWLGGTQVLLRISERMDLVAVKYFLGSAAIVGLYAGSQNIAFAAFMIFSPSNSIVLQSVSASRLRESHVEASHVATSFLRAAFIYGGALVAMTVFSQDIAVFLLGPNFADSGPLLAWLLVAVAFRISAGAGRTLIAAAGEKPSIMLPLAIVVGLGLAVYALVIPRFGAVGGAAAAVGMAFCTAVVSLSDGLRLMKIGLPGGTLLRVVTASASTALFGLFLKRAEWHVLADLTLATLFYGVALILLREWVPTRAHLEKAKAALLSRFSKR
jgi:O-antigen/teichoic acid export membrane protein